MPLSTIIQMNRYSGRIDNHVNLEIKKLIIKNSVKSIEQTHRRGTNEIWRETSGKVTGRGWIAKCQAWNLMLSILQYLLSRYRYRYRYNNIQLEEKEMKDKPF